MESLHSSHTIHPKLISNSHQFARWRAHASHRITSNEPTCRKIALRFLFFAECKVSFNYWLRLRCVVFFLLAEHVRTTHSRSPFFDFSALCVRFLIGAGLSSLRETALRSWWGIDAIPNQANGIFVCPPITYHVGMGMGTTEIHTTPSACYQDGRSPRRE